MLDEGEPSVPYPKESLFSAARYWNRQKHFQSVWKGIIDGEERLCRLGNAGATGQTDDLT